MAQFTRGKREKLAHKSKLGSVYLKREIHGQGTASQLIEMLIKEISTLNGLDKVSLMVVSEHIKAIQLYERLGFVTYGHEPRAINYQGKYYDYNLMILFLNHK